AAPFLERGFPELASIAGGAAEVHLQDRVAAAPQELHPRIEAPRVPEPRSAVRIDDHWQLLRLLALRDGEIAVDREAVARRVGNGRLRGHPGLGQPRLNFAELGELVRGTVVE